MRLAAKHSDQREAISQSSALGVGVGERPPISCFGCLLVAGVFSAVSRTAHGESSATGNEALRDSIAHAAMLRDKALSGSLAMAIVTSLTTEVGPRLAGSAAEVRAREWAVERLADLGLQPIRIEDFDMSAWQRHSEQAEVVMPFPQPLAATALGGSVSTPAGGLTGEVVLFDSLAALRAAPREAVEGKIVYVGHTMQRTQDGSSYGYFNPVRTAGPSVAAQKGALAYLLRSIGTDSHRLPHTGSLRYAENAPKFPRSRYRIPTLIKSNEYWLIGVCWMVKTSTSRRPIPTSSIGQCHCGDSWTCRTRGGGGDWCTPR